MVLCMFGTLLFPMVDGGNCKREQVKVPHLSLEHQAGFDNDWGQVKGQGKCR